MYSIPICVSAKAEKQEILFISGLISLITVGDVCSAFGWTVSYGPVAPSSDLLNPLLLFSFLRVLMIPDFSTFNIPLGVAGDEVNLFLMRSTLLTNGIPSS